MVFLDRLPGLECYVEVAGAKADEYNDDEDVKTIPGPVGEYQASRTVVRYIRAITGAEFSIKCSISAAFKMDSPNILMRVYLDGSTIQFVGPISFHPRSKSSPERYTIQNYKFSELDVSNDEARLLSLRKDMKKAENIGNIEVKIWRASASTPSKSKGSIYRASPGKFHEKALKGQAKSHSVSYSPETITCAPNYEITKTLDGKDYPIAIYKFKYRSKECLRQLMIIERTPEPENSPTPNFALGFELNNLTAAQKERLKEFLRNEGFAAGPASNISERKVKRERDNGEGSSNQAQRKKSRTTEVVDLTADSDEEA